VLQIAALLGDVLEMQRGGGALLVQSVHKFVDLVPGGADAKAMAGPRATRRASRNPELLE